MIRLMEELTLNAESRSELGTRAARVARAAGKLPGVIYGHGETPEAISFDCHDVVVALAHGARTLAVALGPQTKSYLIKDVQYDSFGDVPIHIDLARFDADERVSVMVGVELRGVPKGVAAGGVLDQHLAEIEVECLVTQIPDTLRPRVAELDVGEALFVKDLEVPDGVVVVTDGDDRVASIHAPVAAPEPGEEGDEVPAEPERIGRVRKEDDAEGDAS